MAEKSEQDVNKEVKDLLRDIEAQRKAAQDQGLRFSARSEEELRRKVSGHESSNSPFIYAQYFSTQSTTAPSLYAAYMYNPDPIEYYPLYVSIFFGVANFLDDIGLGLSGRDQRWPLLSSKAFAIAAGPRYAMQTLSWPTPYYLGSGTYLGNAVLWGANRIDKGTYYDRALFEVNL